MGLTITNREWTAYYSTSRTFLNVNSCEPVVESFDLIFDFDFRSSSQDIVQIISPNSLKRLGSSWNDTGVVVGDSVTLSATLTDSTTDPDTIDSIAMTVTIQDIQGDVIIFSSDMVTIFGDISLQGKLFPQQNQCGPFNIVNNTRNTPKEISIQHNIIKNSVNNNFTSIIDGSENTFLIEDVDSMTVGDDLAMVQQGLKSGGRYLLDEVKLLRLSDLSGKKRYTAIFAYLLPVTNSVDFSRPEFFEGSECLKSTVKIEGFPDISNPNSVLGAESFDPIGNTGWKNEEYNQGLNPYTVNSFTIQKQNGDVINKLDHNVKCTVTAVIDSTENIGGTALINIELIVPEDDFKSNSFTNLQNTYAVFMSLGSGVGATSVKNGGSFIIDNTSVVFGINQATLKFDIEPNTNLKAYINSLTEQQWMYVLTTNLNDDDGVDGDRAAVTLDLQSTNFEVSPIPDQLFDGVVSQGFLNHVQSVGDVLTPNFEGRTEDDFLFTSKINLEDGVAWEQMTLDVEVVRNSDNASFDLFSSAFNFGNIPVLNGVIQLNEEQIINQYLEAPERNKISLKNTGVTGTGNYEVQLIWSMMANWKDWISENDAFVDFYNTSLENNGLNKEWVRYLDLTGYTIRARVRLVKEGIAYYFGGNINLLDYDNWAGNSEITLFDESDTEVPVLIDNQVMKVRADHVLSSGSWELSDTWGWISQRGYHQDPNKRISTFWDWTNISNPLKPKSGETKATLEIVTTNTTDDTARIECLVDTSLVNISDYSLTSRIQNPAKPDCMHPFQYIFDYITANSANENDYVATLNILLNKVNANEAPICCPPCTVEYSSFGEIFNVWAFGTKTDIDLIITSAAADDKACCYNTYLTNTEPYTSCIVDETYTEEVRVLAALGGDIDGLAEDLNPTILNSYSENDILLLTSLITNITTDTQIRYDLLFEIIDRGIVMRCYPVSGEKILTRI